MQARGEWRLAAGGRTRRRDDPIVRVLIHEISVDQHFRLSVSLLCGDACRTTARFASTHGRGLGGRVICRYEIDALTRRSRSIGRNLTVRFPWCFAIGGRPAEGDQLARCNRFGFEDTKISDEFIFRDLITPAQPEPIKESQRIVLKIRRFGGWMSGFLVACRLVLPPDKKSNDQGGRDGSSKLQIRVHLQVRLGGRDLDGGLPWFVLIAYHRRATIRKVRDS